MCTFDIVILSWNREEETVRLLDSIHRQHGADYHIWIVDQGSQAACLAVLHSAIEGRERATLLELGENTGVSKGRNIGMEAGNAPFVICIDNDAYFEDTDVLERVAMRFEERNDLGAISFRIAKDKSGEISKSSWPFGPSVPLTQETPCLVTQFAGAAHALRRAALAKTNLYDEKLFFYWEELDLSYQLVNAGYVILYDPSIRVIHNHSPQARMDWHSTRYYFHVRNGLYVRYKYGGSLLEFLMYSAGYFVRGCYNRVMVQSFRGIRDALAMINEYDHHHSTQISQQAREYFWFHSLRDRGHLAQRFFREAFSRLPE